MDQNKLHKMIFVFFLVALVIAAAGIYLFGPSITSFVVKKQGYVDELNLVVTSNGNYTWQPENVGGLKSAAIDGKVTNYGIARAYLYDNGIKYLVFDSTKLNESKETGSNQSGISITGFVAQSDKDKKNNNKKPEWIGGDEFIINGATLINLSQQFIDEDNDILVYSASEVEGLSVLINNEMTIITPTSDKNFSTTITFTASDGVDSKSHTVDLAVIVEKLEENITLPLNETPTINETNQTLNITPTIINKTITIGLDYKTGTIYDANDNGEESVKGVVDLTVEGSLFSWDADETKLCTRWEIYNIDDAILTKLCNGNNDCCAFIGLLPSNGNWNELYYSIYGKDNSGHSNIVSAQVLYYDVNLSVENIKSEIYYSEWGNLSVKFFEEETEFFNICLDSCILSGLNKTMYTLVFEIEEDAVLRIDRIRYNVLADIKNNEPFLLQNFSTVNVPKNKNATINLSEYFADIDGDALTYDYYRTDNITIIFDNDIATIVPDKNVEGARFTYIIANDTESYAVSNVFMINISEEKFAEVNFFEIRDKSNNKISVFDSLGNLYIKGILTQNTEPAADENDFAIQDLSGSLNAVITNPEGDMLIKGSLNEKQEILTPAPNSFVIQDKNNETVAYINSTGNLFLKGDLTENAFFE